MDFPNLNEAQRKQVFMQLKEQAHKDFEADVLLSPSGEALKNFIIKEGVWNPLKVSAKYHASYLFYNNERLFSGKKVLDMGAGTGIMGIIMALYGAKEVTMTDVSQKAVQNAALNVKSFGVTGKTRVIQSDLFEKIHEKFDFIIFNHPFFSDIPPLDNTIAASMLAPPATIQTFLKEAKDFLTPKGIIMMPFFDLAGEANDPTIQGPKFGYKVKTTFRTKSTATIQKGELTIHELTHE